MDHLRGIAFHMRILYVDRLLVRIVLQEKIHLPFGVGRMVELRYLVSHRQVRIEIRFPVESRNIIDGALQCLAQDERFLQYFFAQGRKRSRLSGADRADVGVRHEIIKILFVLALAEHLVDAFQLDVYL